MNAEALGRLTSELTRRRQASGVERAVGRVLKLERTGMLSWWWELLPLWLVRLGARAGCERMRLGGREWLTARPDVLVRVPVCASVVTPNE